MTYPEYMQENIFEPLGMRHSGFRSEDFPDTHAIPHTRINGKTIELPVWNGNGYLMRTTAEDMARFMLALMHDDSSGGFPLLKPETVRIMQTKESYGKDLFHLDSELPDPGYGLGLILYSHGWMGHGGSTVGYQSLWQFHPLKQSGFVILTNVNGILGGREAFDSVWKNTAAIRDLLLRTIDPLAAFEFFPWGYILTVGAVSFLIQILYRVWKKHLFYRHPENRPSAAIAPPSKS